MTDFTIDRRRVHRIAESTESTAGSLREAAAGMAVSPGNPQFDFSQTITETLEHFGRNLGTLATQSSVISGGLHETAMAHQRTEDRHQQLAEGMEVR